MSPFTLSTVSDQTSPSTRSPVKMVKEALGAILQYHGSVGTTITLKRGGVRLHRVEHGCEEVGRSVAIASAILRKRKRS